mgnify:CR=1 FL=1
MGQKVEKIKSQRASQVFASGASVIKMTLNAAGYC